MSRITSRWRSEELIQQPSVCRYELYTVIADEEDEDESAPHLTDPWVADEEEAEDETEDSYDSTDRLCRLDREASLSPDETEGTDEMDTVVEEEAEDEGDEPEE